MTPGDPPKDSLGLVECGEEQKHFRFKLRLSLAERMLEWTPKDS